MEDDHALDFIMWFVQNLFIPAMLVGAVIFMIPSDILKIAALVIYLGIKLLLWLIHSDEP